MTEIVDERQRLALVRICELVEEQKPIGTSASYSRGWALITILGIAKDALASHSEGNKKGAAVSDAELRVPFDASRPQEQPRKATGEMADLNQIVRHLRASGEANMADVLETAVARLSVPPAAAQGWQTVIGEIAAERQRQRIGEGWTDEHDDQHTDGSLAVAAAAYALAATADRADRAVMDQFGSGGLTFRLTSAWPSSWSLDWFKPKTRRADLVRAAALIVAEIERFDRLAAAPPSPQEQEKT